MDQMERNLLNFLVGTSAYEVRIVNSGVQVWTADEKGVRSFPWHFYETVEELATRIRGHLNNEDV